jgi:hypothetical protein
MSIPYEKPFIMDRSLLEILRNTIYRNGYRNRDVQEGNTWAFNEAGLVCLTCEIPEVSDEVDYEEEEDAENEDQNESTSRETLDSLSRAKYLQRLDTLD